MNPVSWLHSALFHLWVGLWTCCALSLEHFISPFPLVNSSSSLSAQLQWPFEQSPIPIWASNMPLAWVAPVSYELFIHLYPQVHCKIFQGWYNHLSLYPPNLAHSKCSMPIFDKEKERKNQSISIYPQGTSVILKELGQKLGCLKSMADVDIILF